MKWLSCAAKWQSDTTLGAPLRECYALAESWAVGILMYEPAKLLIGFFLYKAGA